MSGWLHGLLLGAGRFVEVATVAHVVAMAVVNLTPTPRDDEWLARVYRSVEILAGLVTPLAKR